MKKGIIAGISGIAGAVAGAAAASKAIEKKTKVSKELENKMICYYHVFNQWLSLKQEGKSLVQYFRDNDYKTVGIYGMKELGERLYDELKESDIKIECIIDKNAGSLFFDMDIITPEDEIPLMDVLVVTASYYFDAIETEMSAKVNCPIVSIEDIIYEIE